MISFGRRNAVRDAAALAYGRVVEQARQSAFFTEYGVPDTLDGRFELLCLHAFLYLHRLKSERPQASRLSQAFFDMMFADMDRSLREIGIGDLSVGKHVKRMAKGFYGRVRAYEAGLDADDSALAAALARNLYGTLAGATANLAAMTAYTRAAAAALQRQDPTALLEGCVNFPDVPPADHGAAGSPLAAAGAVR